MYHFLLAALCALFDLRIKDGIEEQSADTFPFPLAGEKIILTRHHNFGFSLNRADKHPHIVRGITTGLFTLLLALFAALLRKPGRRVKKSALALMAGGSASNVLDRLHRGYVVDYFILSHPRFRGLIFNLGDLFIFLGAFLYAFPALFSKEDAK